uniref:Uncharacterized protein n=1 Tax=Megaselia scalaris TaxID=36166 RepID=T1GWZ8_MEGSC
MSNRDLRQTFNLSNSENVFLKNCEIEYFNEDIVSKFPNVAWLDVQNCNVTLKNSGNWNKSSSLEYLAFHQSRIFNNLNSSSLQSFDKLWTILIQNSSLQYSYIDDNLLPKTNNFYNILFDNVNIERINDKVLENLKHSILRISCTSCQLKEIKPIFKNMNYTVYDDFRFSNNKVKKLPSSKDIFKNYDKLLVIDLSNNQIKERILSRKHFKTLKSLKILYLNNNANINFISQFAFNDTALEELNISNVNLRSLGKLGNSNLKKIDVSKNRISKISLEAFEDLIKLEVLDLSNNKILKLNGSEFKDLQSLHELHLSSNKLKEIHENLFNKTSKLQKLDLSLNVWKT